MILPTPVKAVSKPPQGQNFKKGIYPSTINKDSCQQNKKLRSATTEICEPSALETMCSNQAEPVADGMQLLEYAAKGEENNRRLFLCTLILAVDNNRHHPVS
ncbi:MAG: hypothetical protein D3925_06215 [Candidatus Electrothrix sp. AR5]|nr:hypothetical protein [Candidatus Electrothrix sp. AR5]